MTYLKMFAPILVSEEASLYPRVVEISGSASQRSPKAVSLVRSLRVCEASRFLRTLIVKGIRLQLQQIFKFEKNKQTQVGLQFS